MKQSDKIGFIINPVSGTQTKENIPELINEIIDDNQYNIDIRFTDYAGHAKKIARQMVEDNYTVVVAVGGDGTVNEIAKTLIHTNTVLAIIPCGSGNGLARHLEIPLNIREAIELLNNYKISEIDYGTANDIVFFCTCGVGFDAKIGQQFSLSKKRGIFTYFISIVNEYFKYRPKKYQIKTKENKFKKRAFLVTFANASQYGNNAYIAPNADIQDGLLDICILEPFPAYQVLGIGIKLMRKGIDKCQYIEILRTDEVRIKRKKRDVFHFDGEPCIMKKKISIKAHHRGLKVAVPIHSKLKSF